MNDDLPSVGKTRKPKSIWDDGVDWDKVMDLSPRARHEMFPNDFAPNGEPYGDF